MDMLIAVKLHGALQLARPRLYEQLPCQFHPRAEPAPPTPRSPRSPASPIPPNSLRPAPALCRRLPGHIRTRANRLVPSRSSPRLTILRHKPVPLNEITHPPKAGRNSPESLAKCVAWFPDHDVPPSCENLPPRSTPAPAAPSPHHSPPAPAACIPCSSVPRETA